MDITIANVINRSLQKLHSPEGAKLPVGLLGIVSYLRSRGFAVDFRDFQTIRMDPLREIGTLVNFLRTPAPVLAVSCLGPLLPHAVAAVREIKNIYPEKKIVMGGMGPTLVARELMDTFPFIDAIICGEGEESLFMFLSGEPPAKIPGLIYREGSEVVSGKPSRIIENIDDFPLPAYDLWDFEKELHSANIITARGCIFKCPFCSDAYFWERRFRPYGIERVMRDLRTLVRDYGQDFLSIEDSTFTAVRERALRLTGRIIEEGLTFTWGTTARVDCIDEELLKSMKEAGCRHLMIGIESGSPALLSAIKNITIGHIIESIKIISSMGFDLYCSFFWGYPDETLEDFYQTLNLIISLSERYKIKLIFYNFIPFPNLPDFPRFKDRLLFSEELLHLTHNYPYVEAPEVMELVRAHPGLFSSYYFAPSPDLEKKAHILSRL